MPDIVDEEVELHLIDTRQLVEEAKKLKEAKRIEDQSKKIKRQLTFSGSPIPFTGDEESTLPSEVKKQTRKGAISGQRTSNTFTEAQKKIKESQKKIKELERKQKEVKKQVNKIQDDIIDKVGSAGDLLSGGVGVSEIAVIGSRFGPIGILVASAVIALIPIIQKQFERGGIFSIFLKETVQTRTLTDVNELNPIRSGTKFLTDDLRIVQGTPQRSNTQNLKYEHIRYTAQKLGQ